ncbi:MAG: DUF748 domain-containing protein [Myxococcota bacterium]
MATGRQRWVAAGCAAIAIGGIGAVAIAVVGVGGVALFAGSRWEEAARLWVEHRTGGEVTFDDLTVGPTGVTVSGLTIRMAPGGAEHLRIDTLFLGAGPRAFAADPVRFDTVDATGVHWTVARDAAGWPPVTGGILATGGGYDWPAVEVGSLTASQLTIDATTPDGAASTTVATAGGTELRLSLDQGLGWSFATVSASDAHLTVDGAESLAVRSVAGDADGALLVDGLVWTTAVRPDHTLNLPPVVADLAPVWVGGHREPYPADAPWLGVTFEGWPWRPRSVAWTDATVHLTDGVFARPAVDWTVTASTASLGPATDAAAPIAATLGLAGGTVAVTGQVAVNGAIGLEARFTGGQARAFEPYVRATLRELSLELDRGDTSADLRADLRGSKLALRGTVSTANLRFSGAKEDDGGSQILGLASRIATANRDELSTVPVSSAGDLRSASYSPVGQVLDGARRALGGRVGATPNGVVHKVKGVFDKVFGD